MQGITMIMLVTPNSRAVIQAEDIEQLQNLIDAVREQRPDWAVETGIWTVDGDVTHPWEVTTDGPTVYGDTIDEAVASLRGAT